MNRIKQILLTMVVALGMTLYSQAQISTTNTTLSAAVTTTAATTVVVASATGFVAGTTSLFVDREFMDVTSVNGTTIGVRRGAGGIVSAHASGATVHVGPRGARSPFITVDRVGPCTATLEAYLPQINTISSNRYDCSANVWTITGGPATSVTGLSSISSTGNIVSTTGAFVGGTAGSNVGSLVLNNATSGTVTIQPGTGALGSTVVTAPALASGAATLGQIEVSFIDQTTGVATDRTFFVATKGYIVTACSQVHSVAAGGTSTIQVSKETATDAPGAGSDLLTAAFNLNATANTVQAKTSGDFVSLAVRTLAAGNRLSVDYADAIQSSAGIVITCSLIPN
jgi:hypothetical protein